MNKNAKMWARELPSFKQGETCMLGSAEHGYCCLGVAIAIYEREVGVEFSRRTDGRYNGDDDETLANEFGIVRDWLGLKDGSGGFGVSSLSGINDSGKTFSEIQQVIISEPKGLFR